MTPKPEPKVDIGVLEERALKERHFTAAEAQAKGFVPPGQVWDEELQQPVARGLPFAPFGPFHCEMRLHICGGSFANHRHADR